MDTTSGSGDTHNNEERIFETGFKPVAVKLLFIDVTLFTGLLTPCLEAIGKKARQAGIDKLLTAIQWHQHYISRETGKKVLAESGKIEHNHEIKTACSLADKGYDILFAPQALFKRNEKRFDIFLIKNHVILKADLKCIISKNPDTIAKRILQGSEQASRIVVEIASDIGKKQLIDGLRSGVQNNKLIKEILLFYNRHFYQLPKDLIISKRIFELLK
jgi:hypothetical protein